LTGIAMCAAMLGHVSWAIGTWAASLVGIAAVIVPERRIQEVLHAESSQHIRQRLGFLKSQLDRLEERDRLDSVLNRVHHSESALGKITDRFELILATIENHLLMGDHAHAERIITVFARHLRQTLYEGSMPFLPLSASIEHIQTHFDLMQLLTGKRLLCDIDDGMLDDITRSRHTATFLVSDWAQRTLWPYFQLAERSLEPLGDSLLEMDIIGDELVVSYAPPDSMYLPEGTHDLRIEKRFRLLGDPSAAQTGITNHLAEALYA
ncbi:MAG: hypothetical protein ACPH8E_08280, partial [Flavobacteriales bacterium]